MNKNKYLNCSLDVSRRNFLTRVAATGAALSAGKVLAQEAPKPPADPAGTVANSTVMGEKHAGMVVHSERPLTASVPAELHHFAATPNDRMFVRNNLLTPDIDAAQHRLTVKGSVHKEVSFSLDE